MANLNRLQIAERWCERGDDVLKTGPVALTEDKPDIEGHATHPPTQVRRSCCLEVKTLRNVGRVTLAFGAVAISSVALAAPAMAATPFVSVTPSTGLHNLQTVQVKFGGLHPKT